MDQVLFALASAAGIAGLTFRPRHDSLLDVRTAGILLRIALN